MPHCFKESFGECKNPDQHLSNAHICPECKKPTVHVLCSEEWGCVPIETNPAHLMYRCIPCLYKLGLAKDPNPNVEKAQGSEATKVIDLTADVRTIEKNTVAVSTKSSYISTLATVIVFLYTSAGYRSFLTNSAAVSLTQAHAKDNAESDDDPESNGEKAEKKKRKSRTSKQTSDKTTAKGKHPHLYDEAKRLVLSMDRDAALLSNMRRIVSPILYNRFLRPNPSRPAELSWKTLYNRMSSQNLS